MLKFLFLLFIAGVIFTSCSSAKDSKDKTDIVNNGDPKQDSVKEVLIDNGTIWKDDMGQEIYAQAGNILMGRGASANVYNWFGIEFNATGSLTGFVAVNHYTSKDLKKWHKEAPAFTGSTFKQIPAGSWAGRPYVMWNPNDQLYVMVIEMKVTGQGRNSFAFLTTPSLLGQWTYVRDISYLSDELGVQHAMGDLGAYADGNTAYLCYTFDTDEGSNKKQGILKLDSHFTSPLTPASGTYIEFDNSPATGNQCQEANRIFKRGNTYYHFASRTAGWASSTTQYRTSTSVTGPWVGGNKVGSWSPRAQVPTNPVSANTFDTQNEYVIPICGSTDTTYMYVGDRWSRFISGKDQSTGRYVFMPITFDNSSPAIPTINAPNYDVNCGDWYINASTGKWR